MPNNVFTFGSDKAESASSTTITRTATYGAGETIAVTAHWPSDTVTAIVSDGTHTFNLIHLETESTITQKRMAIWEAHNVGAGAFTITVTFSSAMTNRGLAYFRGVNCNTGVGAQDGEGDYQLDPGTATDAVTTGLMTPTSQPNGVLAVVMTFNSAQAITEGTGFTSLGVLTAWNALLGDTSRIEFKRTTSTSDVAGTFTVGGSEALMSVGAVFSEVAGAAIEQEGFRFRADDGSETTATWPATQDTNIARKVGENTRLRVLVNATGDPASEQYQLEFRKVGVTPWSKVE